LTSVILAAVVTLVLLGLLYRLAHRGGTGRSSAGLSASISADDLLPRHYKYFPQIRQALSSEDDLYLRTRVNASHREMARRCRRDAALSFLSGLRDDYRRLDRLARVLTALAPSPDKPRELERMWFAVRFEYLWVLVWMKVWIGVTPITQVQHLAELIGTLAVRFSTGIETLQRATTSQSVQLRA
jgi:hypothetical protein